MPNQKPGPVDFPLTITAFSKDEAARWTYNTISEAKTGPIDLLVIGGGSFGPIFAEHVFRLESGRPDDAAHAPHRTVVIEAGAHALPEHVQNMPAGLNLGLTNFPDELDETVQTPSNVPWIGNVGFPGLAFAVGGRSLFWGGWSPELIESELESWPQEVVKDLKARRFPEAKRQLGTDTTNDFIFGPLHCSLRKRLFQGVARNMIPHVLNTLSEDDLEAPLAVQSAPVRAGFFPVNKFSSVPLLWSAARRAAAEVGGVDDSKKRLIIVPNCKASSLTVIDGRVESIEVEYAEMIPVVTNNVPKLMRSIRKSTLQLSDRGKVVLALGTIETTRLAKKSFDRDLMGHNLMGHLRSNLVIRFPRSTFQNLPSELEASALFLKGRTANGHFHFQITAFGNPTELNPDQEAELFKTVPSLEHLDHFTNVNDKWIIMVIRGIGEMESHRASTSKSRIARDSNNIAKVTIELSKKDAKLWDEMDETAEQVAKVFAGGGHVEFQWEYNWGNVWRTSPPPKALRGTQTAGVRDGLGTTHHEAGTLWMGTDSSKSVTDTFGRFHHIENAFVAGPALFPTIGSPNPMLTGTALARRTAHKIAMEPSLTLKHGMIDALAPAELKYWKMLGNGSFVIQPNGQLTTSGGMGLFWYSKWMLRNFRLIIEWKASSVDDNSGIVVRFPDPGNNLWNALDAGYEIQIDDLARHDDPMEKGKAIYQTGAIYGIQGSTRMASKNPNDQDPWNEFVIELTRNNFNVKLNNEHIIKNFSGNRSLEGYFGLQNHSGAITFRKVLIEPLSDAL